MKKSFIKFILLVIICLKMINLNKIDQSSFANIDQIKQKRVDLNFNINFNDQNIHSKIKLYFEAVKEGDLIILDTQDLDIISVKDADTGKETQWVLDRDYALESLGTPLRVVMEKVYQPKQQVALLIEYKTSPSSLATQWYSKEMTSDQKFPYMYTQCEATLCRSLLPCQDSPAVKVEVNAALTVKKPLIALYSGIRTDVEENEDTTTFYYKIKIPIPTYLIAIAAGDIQGRKLSDRSTVYAEPSVVDKAAYEFAETETFIQIAESYLSPYEWGQYNILVLPKGFPYGGMENPTLTFATPSIIAGDRSLANVVAHEISHSWTGNLVTMTNWQNFWLNEGFTVFVERKIAQLVYGKDLAKLSAQVGYSSLLTDIKTFGEDHSYTSLYPEIGYDNPDDAFSTVPYEKGFNFLYYLESLTGEDIFKLIMKDYVKTYKYKSIDYQVWKSHFEQKIKEYSTNADEILSSVDWEKWIFGTGLPPVENDFSNKFSQEANSRLEDFLNNKLNEDFVKTFQEWHTIVKQFFLNSIYENMDRFTDEGYKYLRDTLKLSSGYNAEIYNIWFSIALTFKQSDIIPKVVDFLGAFGRMKYLRPLYKTFAALDRSKAWKTFQDFRYMYHPLAIRLIEKDFENMKLKSVEF